MNKEEPPNSVPAKNTHEEDLRYFAILRHEMAYPLSLALQLAARIEENLSDPRETRLHVTDLKSVLHRAWALNRSIGMITNTLNFESRVFRSKITTGELQRIVTDCGEDLSFFFRADGRNVGIEIAMDVFNDNNPLHLVADAELLRHAVYSIVENAFKYSRSNTKITVALHVSESRIIVSVTNSGLSISLDDIPHMTERGWRGREAEAISGGSGLGLWSAAQVAKAHGGTIEIHPTEHGITRVMLKIPVTTTHEKKTE